jgi:prevent-host-death family protein
MKTLARRDTTGMNVSKAREEFPDIVNRAAYGKERTIVSRRGKDLAAIIPIEDLRLLELLAQEELDRIDIEDARAALKEAEEKGTISLRDTCGSWVSESDPGCGSSGAGRESRAPERHVPPHRVNRPAG